MEEKFKFRCLVCLEPYEEKHTICKEELLRHRLSYMGEPKRKIRNALKQLIRKQLPGYSPRLVKPKFYISTIYKKGEN